MKIKEYIEVKRQYTPPAIYVKVLQMESLLVVLSKGTDNGEGQDPEATYPDPDEDPFNPNPNP